METNQTLEALIQASPLPILTMDLDQKVTLWNPAVERIFGWSSNEVLGRICPIVPNTEQNGLIPAIERGLQNEVVTDFEMRVLKKDGTLIDVGLWGAMLQDAEGEVYGVMAVLEDLTDRKQAEETLRDLAVMEERNRMAREIHDTLAQGFTGIVLQLEAAEQASEGSPAEVPTTSRVPRTWPGKASRRPEDRSGTCCRRPLSSALWASPYKKRSAGSPPRAGRGPPSTSSATPGLCLPKSRRPCSVSARSPLPT